MAANMATRTHFPDIPGYSYVIVENKVSKPMFKGAEKFVGTGYNRDKIPVSKMVTNMAA